MTIQNDDWFRQLSTEGSDEDDSTAGATPWQPPVRASEADPHGELDAQQPDKSGGRFSKLRSRKDASPKPAKQRPPKAPKPPRTGPSIGQRMVNTGGRLGSDLKQSLLEFHNWAAAVGLVLLASVLWRYIPLLHLSRRQELISVGVGVVLSVGVLWLALQMRKLHRRPGPWTTLLAGLTLVVIVAITVTVCLKRPEWWPLATLVLMAFLACAGLVDHHYREAVIADRVESEVNRRSVGWLSQAHEALQGMHAMVGSLDSLHRTAGEHVTNLGTEREKIEQLTAATHAAAIETHQAAVSSKATADQQKAYINEKVDKGIEEAKKEVIADWRTKGLRDATEEVSRKIAEAVEGARHQEQGKAQAAQLELIERMQHEQIDPLQQENAGLRAQLAQLQQQLSDATSVPAERPTSPTAVPRPATVYVKESGEDADAPHWRR